MQHLFTPASTPPSSDREDEDDETINSIINDLMTEITEQIVSSNETEYVFNHGDHIFSQDFPGQELTEWDNDPPGLWSTPTVRRNLLNEFNTVNISEPHSRVSITSEERVSSLTPALVDITFPNQNIINLSSSQSVAQTIDLSAPETKEEKDIAESLREVMAIVFEHKDEMGDADFLDATNLLKKVYEAKDPRKLKEDCAFIKRDYDELYEEYCDLSRYEKTLQGRLRLLSASETRYRKSVADYYRREKKMFETIVYMKDEAITLKEDINDLQYENERLWNTKFHYQNKLIKLDKEHPDILTEQDKKEVSTIKKRKAQQEPAVLDSLSAVKVNLSFKSGKCMVNLSIKEPECQLEYLFSPAEGDETAANNERGGITYVKPLPPVVVVENLPIIEKERFLKLCQFLDNKRSIRRLWKNPPISIKLDIDSKTGRSTGKAYITFSSAEKASLAVRSSNGKKLDRRFILNTYIDPQSSSVSTS
jgi:hypothetical protein